MTVPTNCLDCSYSQACDEGCTKWAWRQIVCRRAMPQRTVCQWPDGGLKRITPPGWCPLWQLAIREDLP